MFLPGEPFLAAALEQDPALLEHAFARNVVVATPSTLVALLRTVAYTWRQEALADNAQQVHDLGRELYGRLATPGRTPGPARPASDSAVVRLQPDGRLVGEPGAGQRPPAERPEGGQGRPHPARRARVDTSRRAVAGSRAASGPRPTHARRPSSRVSRPPGRPPHGSHWGHGAHDADGTVYRAPTRAGHPAREPAGPRRSAIIGARPGLLLAGRDRRPGHRRRGGWFGGSRWSCPPPTGLGRRLALAGRHAAASPPSPPSDRPLVGAVTEGPQPGPLALNVFRVLAGQAPPAGAGRRRGLAVVPARPSTARRPAVSPAVRP